MLVVLSLVIASLLPGLHAFPDYFERQPEDAQLDEWMKEQLGQSQGMMPSFPVEDEVGHASPGHMEEHDFMTAFFQNQEDEDSFGEMEEDDSDGNVENYIADFFGHTPDTGAQNYFEGEAEEPAESMSEEPYISQEEEEEEAEEEDEGPYADEENAAGFQFYGRNEDSEIMSPFHEFPPDDLFAEIQDTGIPECEEYKKKVAEAQKKLNEDGKELNKTIDATEKEIDAYEKDIAKECSLNCETVCIPTDEGEECVETKNGTCTVKQPKINECGRKVPDPACKAKEDECKGEKKKEATKMVEAEKKLDAAQARLKKLEDNLLKVVENIPEKCKTLRL